MDSVLTRACQTEVVKATRCDVSPVRFFGAVWSPPLAKKVSLSTVRTKVTIST